MLYFENSSCFLTFDKQSLVSLVILGSNSIGPNSQVTLITLVESNSVHPTHLVKQTFAHPDGEVVGLTALPAQPDWFVTTFSHCESFSYYDNTSADCSSHYIAA